MDFVISKVVMSVCALLVAGILSGLIGMTGTLDNRSELKGVLKEFAGLVERTARSGAEAVVEWTVPTLSDGGKIKMTITSVAVSGEAGGHKYTYQPAVTLHLWSYVGTALNATEVSLLDKAAFPIDSGSGEVVRILTEMVTFENEPSLFAFVGT